MAPRSSISNIAANLTTCLLIWVLLFAILLGDFDNDNGDRRYTRYCDGVRRVLAADHPRDRGEQLELHHSSKPPLAADEKLTSSYGSSSSSISSISRSSVREAPICLMHSRLRGKPLPLPLPLLTSLTTSNFLPEEPEEPRVVVVGDIHGDLDGLLEVLGHAGVISSYNGVTCNWFDHDSVVSRGNSVGGEGGGQRLILIQMGDIVDRGRNTSAVAKCLDDLQDRVPRDTTFIRLIGNHELLWMQGHFDYKNKKFDTDKVIQEVLSSIKRNIMSGNIMGSYYFKHNNVKFLLTHAGVRAKMYDYILSQLQLQIADMGNGHRNSNIDIPFLISSYINRATKSIVNACSMRPNNGKPAGTINSRSCKGFESNELYLTGMDRGGSRIGGPFWTDFSVLQQEASSMLNLSTIGRPDFYLSDTVQIVGHTPDVGRIKISRYLTSICVDVGIFMKGRGYLTIEPDGRIIAMEKAPSDKMWRARDLIASICD